MLVIPLPVAVSVEVGDESVGDENGGGIDELIASNSLVLIVFVCLEQSRLPLLHSIST